jgi:hypothetical protein
MTEMTESPRDVAEDGKKAESPRDVLLTSLAKFYANPVHLAAFTDVVLKNRAEKPTGISLRVLDWLVTNYCKKENIVYVWDDRCFNMWANYKAQLRGFSKRLFDPFKRRDKKRGAPGDDYPDEDDDDPDDLADLADPDIIQWADAEGKKFLTTVGQLNFFKWAIENGVLEYCINNSADVEKDMHVSTQHRYAPRPVTAKKGRRSELSKVSVIKSCSKTRINVTLVFDCR